MKPLLTGLLLAAILVGILAWTWLGAPDYGWDLSLHGWIAMGIGTVLTIGLAAGLMGLVFYSARRGYDERVPRDDQPDP